MKQLFLIIAILLLQGCNKPEGENIMEVADEETFEELLSIPITEQPPAATIINFRNGAVK